MGIFKRKSPREKFGEVGKTAETYSALERARQHARDYSGEMIVERLIEKQLIGDRWRITDASKDREDPLEDTYEIPEPQSNVRILPPDPEDGDTPQARGQL